MNLVKTLPLFLLLSASGCALTSKAEPLDVRYFSPRWEEPARATTASADARPSLRFGRITSSAHLRNRIVYRSSPVEVAMYEDRRWTEKPEEYVRRAVSRSLFEERPIVRALSGDGPALDVELLAFDEVRGKDGRAARVTVHYAVQDERVVFDAQTLTVEAPVSGDASKTENFVAAMGVALHDLSEQLASRVATRLAAGQTQAQASAAR